MTFIKMEDIGIQALSHSRMKTHEQCPRKAKYKFIDKLKEPSNEAMERGSTIHKELENWMIELLDKGESDVPIPSTGAYAAVQARVKELVEEGYSISPESQVAFTREWEPCDWFAPNTWMRVVYDFVAVGPDHVVVADYKTGKVYDDHEEQAKLYAMGCFHEHDVSSVEVVFYYLDQSSMQVYNYTRDDIYLLNVGILERANRVNMDRLFPTNPSYKCRWCHFRKENGGPCAH
jgi:CRISPR/Cas system-associated exonuclease Cas4 (RecB family)